MTESTANTVISVKHLTCHYGKTTALFPSACRFDSGVQSQQIGLEGNLINDANNVRDLFATAIDLAHGANRLAYHITTAFGLGAGIRGQLICLFGIVGILAYGGGHFFHTGGGLFQ